MASEVCSSRSARFASHTRVGRSFARQKLILPSRARLLPITVVGTQSGPVRRALLLVEVRPLDPVRIALERQRPVAQVAEQHGRDARVVLDHVPLGESRLGIHQLVQVRQRQGAPVDLDLEPLGGHPREPRGALRVAVELEPDRRPAVVAHAPAARQTLDDVQAEATAALHVGPPRPDGARRPVGVGDLHAQRGRAAFEPHVKSGPLVGAAVADAVGDQLREQQRDFGEDVPRDPPRKLVAHQRARPGGGVRSPAQRRLRPRTPPYQAACPSCR